MKAKNCFTIYALGTIAFLSISVQGWGQTGTIPTPTPIPFNFDCMLEEIDTNANLITNGDFSSGTPIAGLPPVTGWQPGTNAPVLRKQTISTDRENFFLEFSTPGTSITAIPKQEPNFTRFELKFCAVVPAGGQLQVFLGDSGFNLVGAAPVVAGSGFRDQFKQEINLNLGSDSSFSESQITIRYEGSAGIGPAFIDNVELLPLIRSGSDSDTPTPTPEEPTPTPKPAGPSPTPTPTIAPGIPTPTPTPAITAQSVQMLANPQMLVVKTDDFALQGGVNSTAKKQVALDLQVIGSNGQPINILNIDPEAKIRFQVDTSGEAIDVGDITVFNINSRNWQTFKNRQIDLGDFMNDFRGRAYFFPKKPFEGTVRIIAEIEYDGFANGKEETIKIRGVAPIVMRLDNDASLTNATGSLNAVQNINLGRKPGDRGFRPDSRTNLYFRERMQ